MPARSSPNRFALLGRCADFYQEIANIKLAAAEGRLADWLTVDGSAPPVLASEYASRVSARLLALLRRQERDYGAIGTPDEHRAHKVYLYLMAALADEILILELDWPGRDAWLDVLLEQRLFTTNNAGSRFFTLAQQLLQGARGNPVYIDLAAVFLLAMELGFKGRYRGRQGQAALTSLRQQLYHLVEQGSGSAAGPGVGQESAGGMALHHARRTALASPPACAQAYDYLLRNGKDERLAPLSPWYSLGLYALLGYVLVSMLTWLILMHPFEKFIGN
jgi:type VI secretion system protein ImpK